ncbi:hypothetical protein KY321_03720 [Candidatus Woesearchaeota archaeon]|nr:hypothetical protein [Candidatus Woesearchaeota archaeon]
MFEDYDSAKIRLDFETPFEVDILSTQDFDKPRKIKRKIDHMDLSFLIELQIKKHNRVCLDTSYSHNHEAIYTDSRIEEAVKEFLVFSIGKTWNSTLFNIQKIEEKNQNNIKRYVIKNGDYNNPIYILEQPIVENLPNNQMRLSKLYRSGRCVKEIFEYLKKFNE